MTFGTVTTVIIIIITDEYDLSGSVALLLQDHLTLLMLPSASKRHNSKFSPPLGCTLVAINGR